MAQAATAAEASRLENSSTAACPQDAGSHAPTGAPQHQQAEHFQQTQQAQQLQEAQHARHAQQATEAQQARHAQQAGEAHHAQQAQQAGKAQHAQQAHHVLEPQHAQQAREDEQSEQLQAVDSLLREEEQPQEVTSESYKQSWLSALKPLNIGRKRKSSAEHATVRKAVVDTGRAEEAAANVETPNSRSKGKRMQKVASIVKKGIPGCLRVPDVRAHSQASADVQPLPATADSYIMPQPQQQAQQQQQQQKKKQGLKSKASRSSMFAAFKCKFVNGNKPVQPGAAQEVSHTLRDQPAASPDTDISTDTGVLMSKHATDHENRYAVSGFAGSPDTEPAQDGGSDDLIAAVRAPPDLSHVQQSDMQRQGANSATIGVSVQQVSFPTLVAVQQIDYHSQLPASSYSWPLKKTDHMLPAPSDC